eukprot:scaffold9793_cov144-Skeletonema_menzelii.AAC.9
MTSMDKNSASASSGGNRSPHHNLKNIPAQWSERVTPLERTLVPKFAARAYHLPGNSLCGDWMQYMLNNHPVIGICCHHRLHPLKTRQRSVILLGSFAFGVAITNVCYLWFIATGRDAEEEVFSIDLNTPDSAHYSVTAGLVMLVTVGSGLHTVFDRFIWSVSACRCCRAGGTFETNSINSPRRGRWQDVGTYLVVLLVVLVIAAATFIVIMRAKMDNEGQTEIPYIQDSNTTLTDIVDSVKDFTIEDFSFMKAYCIEFAVSLFVYYPFFETVLFSGVLGCFRLPGLGGRPYEVRKEEKKNNGRSGARRVSAVEMT